MAEALLAEHRRAFPRWLELLGPAAAALVPPLGAICRDPDRDAYAQAAAAEALAELLGRGRRDLALARTITEATPVASRVLLRESAGRGPSPRGARRSSARCSARSPRSPGPARPDERTARRDRLAARQAAAATALAALGEPEPLWPLLRHRPDPRLRSLLIQRLAADVLPARLLDRAARRPDLDPIECQALLLAWAESRRDAIPPASRPRSSGRARDLYVDHPHPGVHAAAGLLLRRWGDAEFLAQADERPPARLVGPDGLGWERGPNGHDVRHPPRPAGLPHGLPRGRAGPLRRSGPPPPQDRPLAGRLDDGGDRRADPRLRQGHTASCRYAGEPGCAANNVDWFRAARYCNWLSREAGIDPARWCYPEPTADGMIVPADAVEKEGFRLPTEAEWEYICRAGTETARYFGESQTLLSRYAWTWLNSDDRVHPVGLLLPNEFGMFDILGNVWEWCHDGPAGGYPEVPLPAYPPGTREQPAPDPGHARPSSSGAATARPGGSSAAGASIIRRSRPARRTATGSAPSSAVPTSASASSGRCAGRPPCPPARSGPQTPVAAATTRDR